MAIPLLSDLTQQIGKDYGVYVPADGHTLRSVKHLSTLSTHFRSGTFIIDPKGTLRHIDVNDYPVGRDVNEVYRLVQAFQVWLWGFLWSLLIGYSMWRSTARSAPPHGSPASPQYDDDEILIT